MSQQRLLIIGHRWPEPKATAAGSRMIQLIELFGEAGYELHFASASGKSDNATDLTALHVHEYDILLNDSSFDAFIKELSPSIVMYDRYMTEEQYGWRVSETCPSAVTILDTEDLHCLRHARYLAHKRGEEVSKDDLQSDIALREIASILRCDLTLMISEIEINVLVSTYKVPKELLCYVPFMVGAPSKQAIRALPSWSERRDFVTIGNLLHQPNYDGVLWLKSQIWPKIRKLMPDAQLHIYGAYMPSKVQQLDSRASGFHVRGFVEDVESALSSARVCLAALRFGAGLKGKLIDAMMYGTPCAMTSIAAEGMFAELSPSGLIADDPDIFAYQAVALYQDYSLWAEAQRSGFQILKKRFSKSIGLQLLERVAKLQTNLIAHRQANFLGQVLRYHTLQSTKYMSKWIEAKGRR